ncbi:hypothetical protein Tco_0859849 [Tanacetum coccineum]|uniref:Uncharacterized protein n=1 Tax=Tanacetum coccineum TaxID=301880 RepID=A0ABQ5BGF2_9ASTR
MSRGIKSNVDVGKSWGAYFQLWVRLIVEINVVVDGGLVLQTVKTDTVKHDVEVESLGKCVDEIDKPTELTGKHEADQHCLNGFRESQFKHNPKLVTPSSVMEGQASGPFFTEQESLFLSGGDGSGNDTGTGGGNGDEALNLPMAALKAWGCTHMGGDNEMSGEGGGVGKARSLSTSSSGGNSIGASGRIDILAVVRHAGGDGSVAADSSVLNGSVTSKEETWSVTVQQQSRPEPDAPPPPRLPPP